MAGMVTRSVGDTESAEVADATWQVSRRRAICSAAGVCAGTVAVVTGLTACGSDDSSDPNGSNAAGSSTDGQSKKQPSPSQGELLAKLPDVPVGGGKLVTGASGLRVMLTQPSPGVIKAFDARCTHQRTIVEEPQNGIMTCPNHGSRFKVADGAVVRGPATAALATVAVRVSGSDIVTA